MVGARPAGGWTFTAPLRAFADPAYAQPPDVLLAGGGIIWAHATAAGVAAWRHPGEDVTYEEPGLRSLGLLPPPR